MTADLTLSGGGNSQQTVEQLARLYSQKDLVNDINVPIEVIKCVSPCDSAIAGRGTN